MRNDFGTRPYASRFNGKGMKKGGAAKRGHGAEIK